MEPIQDIPSFLGCRRGSKENYQVDLTRFEKVQTTDGPRYRFGREGVEERFFCRPDRYALFDADKGDGRKQFLRFSEKGGLAHIGIAGAVATKEFPKYETDLSLDDVIFHQSHHGEPVTLIAKECGDGSYLRVEALGGGFMEINPEEKIITLKGVSKSLGPEQGSPTALHVYAIGHIREHLESKGITGYSFHVEGLEGIAQEDLNELVAIFSTTRVIPDDVMYMVKCVMDGKETDEEDPQLKAAAEIIRDHLRQKAESEK